jgi:hypothetical protein
VVLLGLGFRSLFGFDVSEMVFPAVAHDGDDASVGDDGSQKSAVDEVGGTADLRWRGFFGEFRETQVGIVDVR